MYRYIKGILQNIIIKFHSNKSERLDTDLKKQTDKYFCPVCNQEISHFVRLPDYYIKMLDKYQFIHSIFYFETLNLLNYFCPNCYSSDRVRLYALFLKRKLSNNFKGDIYKILDIAPDKTLAGFIKNFKNIDYKSVDLYMENVDDKADITNLQIYKDEIYDIIICSHVLEHVVDDRRALDELFRVLKIGGWAIIMVPILLSLKEDLENSNWTTPEDHWKYYGQDDHIRMYSKKGFISKLNNAGFKVLQLGKEYFGEEVFDLNGVHHRSILYVVEK